MCPTFQIALTLALTLAAFPTRAEAPSLTEDEIRIADAIGVETYRDICSDMLGPPSPAMRRLARRAEQDYVASNGRAAWDVAIAEARAETAQQITIDSPHYYCAYIHEFFVDVKEIDTGLTGPSFRCGSNISAVRQAICDSGPVAWGYDRALVRLTEDVRPMLNEKGLALIAEFKDSSETYILKCGTREGCVTNNLALRMQRLSDVYIKVGKVFGTEP
jgi:hypothetical protein